MKSIIFFLLLLPLVSISQKVDTIINSNIYKSYYNYNLKQPLFVIYKLYKGGGSCSRKGLTFKTGGIKSSATQTDYHKSGYDQGHLANFEDFASDCKNGELTFRYYNVIPQCPNLNRGVWKMYEFMIREISQKDSLLIIAGGTSYNKKIGNGLYVPDYCWKIVYSLSKKTIIYALYFKNDMKDSWVTDETITTIETKTGYSLRQYLN